MKHKINNNNRKSLTRLRSNSKNTEKGGVLTGVTLNNSSVPQKL